MCRTYSNIRSDPQSNEIRGSDASFASSSTLGTLNTRTFPFVSCTNEKIMSKRGYRLRLQQMIWWNRAYFTSSLLFTQFPIGSNSWPKKLCVSEIERERRGIVRKREREGKRVWERDRETERVKQYQIELSSAHLEIIEGQQQPLALTLSPHMFGRFDREQKKTFASIK